MWPERHNYILQHFCDYTYYQHNTQGPYLLLHVLFILHTPAYWLTSAVFLPIRPIRTTISQAIQLIADCVRTATGNDTNRNRLQTTTHQNAPDRGNKSIHSDDSWWPTSGLACVNQQYGPQCCIFDTVSWLQSPCFLCQGFYHSGLLMKIK